MPVISHSLTGGVVGAVTGSREPPGVNPFAATHFLGGYLVVVGVCVGV